MDKLNLFFSKFRELTFFQRLFSWRGIKNLSYDAYEEFKSMEKMYLAIRENFENLKKDFSTLTTKNEALEEKVHQCNLLDSKKDLQITSLTTKIQDLNTDIGNLRIALSKFENTEEERRRNYERKITELNQLKETLDKEIKRLNDERVNEKQTEFLKKKKQWSEHQMDVQNVIKTICQKHFIKYIEKVPFRGSPDNTISICDEFIIFDAKCPSNDDLINFPKYLRIQTESVRKYTDQENVKKDIFLVVPTNCISYIPQLSYNMGDYNVYIISKDSLEPIILSLKKVEDYEFAEQLSPEERDNICRVIGKFAHTTKRKIQIDQFFANEFLDLLVRCKNDLPEEILQHVIEYEKAEKLNPPLEKKAKQILTKDLLERNQLINTEASIKGVAIPISFEDIKNLE
ncbi:MAG: hypothetical protein ICV66_04785 [Chitinophagaceae bacterium]|nr:hypothetical protein [Chitinophagaceae bacterium]